MTTKTIDAMWVAPGDGIEALAYAEVMKACKALPFRWRLVRLREFGRIALLNDENGVAIATAATWGELLAKVTVLQ